MTESTPACAKCDHRTINLRCIVGLSGYRLEVYAECAQCHMIWHQWDIVKALQQVKGEVER